MEYCFNFCRELIERLTNGARKCGRDAIDRLTRHHAHGPFILFEGTSLSINAISVDIYIYLTRGTGHAPDREIYRSYLRN